MPIFQYEAKLLNGEIKKGKIDAVDENAVRTALRAMNCYPLMIKEEGKGNIDLGKFASVKTKDIAIFCRKFSYILVSGMNIVKALEILKDETENKKLAEAVTMVYDDVQKGRSLSASMKNQSVFPEMLINMVAVGEASGSLDEIMVRMADYYDKEYEQVQKVKQAMTYPIIIAIVAVIVVNLLIVFVLPKLLGTMMDDPEKLPLPTKILLGMSNFMRNYWYIILFVVVALIVVINIRKKNEKSIEVDKFKLKIPVFGKLTLKIAQAKFARTFGMLLNSGLPVIESMTIASRILENKYLESILAQSVEDVKKGISISASLKSKEIFSTMLIQMIKIGEESGTLDDVLGKTAAFYDKEADTATAQMTTMIEPIIIMLLAVVVGFIIIAVIIPMFDSYDTVAAISKICFIT
ncbi:MAG: type II secretion system F family protein [Clostridiales bacterium]|nr:type II secretion system F family protein [Clostridiales bacterium]